MSSLTWLDYSSEEQKRILDTVKLLDEPGTRDELGIGMVRDSFADQLFPGTSTIQTRARYFLFVPWIYLKLERQGTASSKAHAVARKDEIALIDALAASGETSGLIGVQARAGLQRLPSSIYWNGLGLWGIRLCSGSQDQYHRSLDRFHVAAEMHTKSEAESRARGEAESLSRPPRNWHAGIPSAPKHFLKETGFALTAVEAEYLRERIMTRVPDTLLAFLVDEGRPGDPVDFPWEHPQAASFPAHIREQLAHARNFSEVIHGAALLYNLMLARRKEHKDWIDLHAEGFAEWVSMAEARAESLSNWDRQRFWEIAASGGRRILPTTRGFIDQWVDLVLEAPNGSALAESRRAFRLIEDRECAIKTTLARLTNQRALDAWGGRSGDARLDFRWRVSQDILGDILAVGANGDASA